MQRQGVDKRARSVWAFSLLFAYVLSFLFEGKALYGLLEKGGVAPATYVLTAIVAHFFGLFTCGLFCKSPRAAKATALASMGLCLLLTLPFFFAPSALWFVLLAFCGYAAGCAVAAWGYFLKAYTPKDERIHTCADMLIYSNLLMIAVNIAASRLSPRAGLALSMLCLAVGLALAWRLPVDERAALAPDKSGPDLNVKRPMGVLFAFVAIITVDSGLMYQVINPAFAHLTELVSWYWAAPYILALLILRKRPVRANRSPILYLGMAMIMGAFVCFMLFGRGVMDYLVVDTLMLGACGIFDLFWWSILGETLEYAKNPAAVFGVGLSANVFGVLCGDVIGLAVTSARLPNAQVAVIALSVVCVTLILLPPLNRTLTMLLKSHAYLSAYSALPEPARQKAASSIAPLDALTQREKEILQLVLEGRSNREIAALSAITENTVKTHIKRIYSKYAVGSRAELISLLLRNQRL